MNKKIEKSSPSAQKLKSSKASFVFFGSSPISVTALNELEKKGFIPKAVVTQPDKPQGRGLQLTSSPVKVWAEKRNIKTLTPTSLRDPVLAEQLNSCSANVFILVSYGKIIPKAILDIPKFGILNLHPSLLPKLRGPSPIESTILNDMKDEVGVTIMLLDQKMDEGPILAQKNIKLENWPPKKSELYKILSEEGGRLLAETIPPYLEGKIKPTAQDFSKATYCKKIEKNDGLIDLSADPYQNFLKISAFEGWPGTFFMINHKSKNMRVKITDATFKDDKLVIKKIIPEGRKEMCYNDFINGIK